jgi:type I site-specific restriction endonuclease
MKRILFCWIGFADVDAAKNDDPAKLGPIIDDFKSDKSSDPIIAISVDMLDTGIDVPEIVNLVSAKPVRSQVKFEQMIGNRTNPVT